MQTDPFIAEFAGIMDRKAGLMRDLVHTLAKATASADVGDALRLAALRFKSFSESVEVPFGKVYDDRFQDPPLEVREHFARHHATIAEFIHALQRLKYGADYQGDEQVKAAVAAFEFATCQIPPPGSEGAN